ncbi:hypothetical protein [uncultured Sphingomonas sp.]|nr:hypothetical protein [uncultured Sphingomonas sp.]
MLIEAILEYLGAIGGPDRGTWKLWLGIVLAGAIACALLAYCR